MIFIDKISLKSLKPLKLIDACTVNSSQLSLGGHLDKTDNS